MTENVKSIYTPFNKSVVRRPLRPLNNLTDLESHETLKQYFKGKLEQEALFIASPELHSKCLLWVDDKLDLTKKTNRNVPHSLMKYMIRLCSRPTPFGLFASCGIADYSQDQDFFVEESGQVLSRSTRLDMQYLCALAFDLSNIPEIKSNLTYSPNTSLYKIGSDWRYVEHRIKKAYRTHHLVAAQDTDELSLVLDKATEGVTIQKLIQELRVAGIDENHACSYLDELIEAQLLVSNLEPGVTGTTALKQICDVLAQIPIQKVKLIHEKLIAVNNLLLNLDSNSQPNSKEDYLAIGDVLSELGTSFELKKLFQTDLYQQKTTSLSITLPDRVLSAMSVLKKLAPMRQETSFDQFKEAFRDRYDSQQVPLLLVLDDDIGLSYPYLKSGADVSPLVDDLQFNTRNKADIPWSTRDHFLLKRYVMAIEAGHYEFEILPDQVELIESDDQRPNADTISAMVSIVGEGEGGEEIVEFISSSNFASKLLGRFAHLDDGILHLCEDIAKKEREANPNVICAEIAHLPQSRTGNVLFRPVLSEYEITYLAKSGVDSDHQIGLQDLMLCLKNDRLVLWSKKFNKAVEPRLSNAHNYHSDVQPVYRFLCDIINQDVSPGIGFSWGAVFTGRTFLPRVTTKNIILSPATWFFSAHEIQLFIDLIEDEKQLMNEIATWRKKYRIPNWILLAEGDNEMLINLEVSLFVQTFLQEIKNKPSIILKEFLHIGNEGEANYTKQVIIPFHKKNNEYKEQLYTAAPALENDVPSLVQRKFVTGEEWLYVKVYCGTRIADKVLSQILAPLAQKFEHDEQITKWFFIRYSDPNNHLRIRFRVVDKKAINEIQIALAKVLSPLINANMIDKIQYDTYDRELERYGAETIEEAEALFYCDSMMIAHSLQLLHNRDDDRWLFGLKSIDALLNDFELTLDEKFEVASEISKAFGNEFGMTGSLKDQVQKKYREHRQSISDILDGNYDDKNEWKELILTVNQRSSESAEVCAVILEKTDFKQLRYLLPSYIHMAMNRLFASRQRQHELVLYNLLWNHYRSEIAKAKMQLPEIEHHLSEH